MSQSGSQAIEVHDVTKQFGRIVALNRINLTVPRGDCLTIFGANGAGKTTLLRIVGTFNKPTYGSVRVNGIDVLQTPQLARSTLGLISHQLGLYADLTPRENLRFFGKIYGVENLEDRIQSLLQELGLGGRADDPVRGFSRGMQQRMSLARAFLHDPPLLLLDEPFTGLDLEGTDLLYRSFERWQAEGRTIVMTTHQVERGIDWARNLLLIHKGRIVHTGPKGNITAGEFRELYREKVQGS